MLNHIRPLTLGEFALVLVCLWSGFTLYHLGWTAGSAQAQTYCTNLGSVTICDGGSTTITPLGRNGGVITTDRDVIPYAIMPAPDHARAGIEPLRELDRLPGTGSSRPDPFRDELRSPFDLEPRDGLLLLPE